jgi:hypothetical protein
MVIDVPKVVRPKELCSTCCTSKQPRKSYKAEIPTQTTSALQLIHSDVCGPFEEPSLGGSAYFVSFTDYFTKKIWVYLLERKSEVLAIFRNFKAMAEKQEGKTI